MVHLTRLLAQGLMRFHCAARDIGVGASRRKRTCAKRGACTRVPAQSARHVRAKEARLGPVPGRADCCIGESAFAFDRAPRRASPASRSDRRRC